MLNYIFSNFDKGIIGKILGIEELGLYTRAYFLATIPVSHIFNAISPVVLNAFRQAMDDPIRLRNAFFNCFVVYCGMALGICAVLFVFASSIISFLYGERWLPIVPIFKILVIYGMSKGITTICPPILFLKNKPWIISATTALMVAIFGMTCFKMTLHFGAIGTAWSVLSAGVISHAMVLSIVFRMVSLPKKHEVN